MREKNKKIDFEGSGVGGSLREINLTDTFDLTDRERLGNLTDTSRRQSIFLKKGGKSTHLFRGRKLDFETFETFEKS